MESVAEVKLKFQNIFYICSDMKQVLVMDRLKTSKACNFNMIARY